jgi:adenine-specific DNA-methyltransferase
MLLGRCEFGKEDYSLNIINMPVDPDEPDFIPKGFNTTSSSKKKKNGKTEPNLFNSENGGEE